MKAYLKRLAEKSISTIANVIADEWVSGQLQLTPILAEFPKSGGSIVFTVLNFIVARSDELCNPVPHIYSCTNYGVDLDRAHTPLAFASALQARGNSPLGVVKTHSLFRKEFRYVICLYREPLAVMRSYYRYLASRGDNDYQDLATLMHCKKRGIASWADFHDSYLKAPQSCHLYFCRYESFVNKPVQFFDNILQSVYGLQLKSNAHQIVAKISSLDHGQYYEDLVLQNDPRKEDRSRFIGSSAYIPGETVAIPAELQGRCDTILLQLQKKRGAEK